MKLKELYDSKYKKYIMVNNEYHSNITEKEYLLENEENLSEEKKTEMKSIIDSIFCKKVKTNNICISFNIYYLHFDINIFSYIFKNKTFNICDFMFYWTTII